MRLSRLDLARYGRFTDASLSFGTPGEGAGDLHILYGDNEAGKTTTYNAMLDLLFGIEPNTSYGYLHPLATMRVGGAIEGAAGSREVVRLGRTRGLLDAAEHPSPEGPVPSELAGMGRGTYRQMFSLDEATLAAGGESILKAEGDLGELLFSATAGLADFSKALAGLRAESEAFFKTNGRKHALADFKKQLADLKERKAVIDVLAATYVRLTSARDLAREAYDRAAAERARLRTELEEVGRHAAALPRLLELVAVRRELEAYPALPAAPPSWREDLPDLQRREVELSTRRAVALDEVERLSAALAEPAGDEAALDVAPLLSEAADLRARHATAVKDLPDRRASLRRECADVAAIAADLDREEGEAARLPLPSEVVDALREAMERLSGLETRREEAQAERGQALRRLAEARADLAQAGGGTCARDQLVAALGAAQGDDVEARVRIAGRDRAAKAEILDRRLASLAPWRGDLETLAALTIPGPEERERVGTAHEAALADVERRDGEVARLEDEVHRQRARREALSQGGALVEDAAAAATRADREAAWNDHLARLDAASASVFERVLRTDDEVGATRLSQAEALGELRAADLSLAATTSELVIARTRTDAARRRLGETAAAIAGLLAGVAGGDRDWTLATLESLVAARARALEAHGDLRVAERDLAYALEDGLRIRRALTEAIEASGCAAAGDRTDVAGLAVQARAIVDADARRRDREEAVERLGRELEGRERQVETARADRLAWDEDWRVLLGATWLPVETGVARVRSVLGRLEALAPMLARRDALADRVAKMEADEAAFAELVASLAGTMRLDGRRDAVATTLRAIDLRIEAARVEEGGRLAKARTLEAARERLAGLLPELGALAARKDEMTSRFGVASLADVALALEASRRRDELVARAGAIGLEIVAICAMRSLAEAEIVLSPLDPQELERRRVALAALREDQDLLTQRLFADLGRAQEALDAVDGDAAAARLEEERRTVLLEIEERTLSHLAMRAGIVSAEVAVRLFRERHRSSMMANASDIFRNLTRGAYDGLVAQGGGGGEVLVGLVAEGGSRLSHQMSTATRNQLYLALRMAGYREYAKTRRPPPFVLDDVLETFDDERAEAALVQLDAMAATGQVVYLTHHRHLCEMARRACPRATIRGLPAR